MSLPMPFAGIDAADGQRASPREQDYDSIPLGKFDNMLLIDQLRLSWSSIALGIILAGGFYPILAALLVVVIESGGLNSSYEVIEITLAASLFALIGAVVGMVWTNVCVVATLPLLLIVVWSLRIRGNIIWVGASWGGLVGFLAVLPFLFWGGSQDRLVLALLLGPALTTILGQAGGAWGGRRALGRIDWYERALARATVGERLTGAPIHEAEPVADEQEALGGTVRFQFRIRHLLWTAVWISILLSAIRSLGIPFEIVLPFLGGWLAYQTATLWIGVRLVRLVAR